MGLGSGVIGQRRGKGAARLVVHFASLRLCVKLQRPRQTTIKHAKPHQTADMKFSSAGLDLARPARKIIPCPGLSGLFQDNFGRLRLVMFDLVVFD